MVPVPNTSFCIQYPHQRRCPLCRILIKHDASDLPNLYCFNLTLSFPCGQLPNMAVNETPETNVTYEELIQLEYEFDDVEGEIGMSDCPYFTLKDHPRI